MKKNTWVSSVVYICPYVHAMLQQSQMSNNHAVTLVPLIVMTA